ncbi:MAG TPA: hypothetical protein VFF74_03960 [Methylophilaceae bacterium]|nr:hypothetical protein [Methylophilaceae bacterium]
MKTLFLALLLALSGTAVAEATENPTSENPKSNEIPTTEKEFVATINGFDKAQILEQFGEPSKMDDVKTTTGKVVASIWHYHFINTNDEGAYYETTELDFVDDKVVMVVFMNNNGEDAPAGTGQPVNAAPEIEPKL